MVACIQGHQVQETPGGREDLAYSCDIPLDPKVSALEFVVIVQSLSRVLMQPHGLQHTRLPCPLPSPGACSYYAHQIADAIQPSHHLLSPSPLAFNLSQH